MRGVRDFFKSLTLAPQGATIIAAGFLPIFAIVSMFPIVSSMIRHFSSDPSAQAKVPLMVTAPGLAVAIVAPFMGLFIDRYGRRQIALLCTLFYGCFGALPFLLNDLDHIFASRLALGVCEAGILTVVNTLLGDYWDDKGRRNWLFLQGVLGPFLAAGVVMASGAVASVRWNAGFLIYLVAFPIWIAMLLTFFEPTKRDVVEVAAANSPHAKPFPIRDAIYVGTLTLLASALYYVFIVNGSVVFEEVGVNDPALIGRYTAAPSLCLIIGAAIFRALSRKPNGWQIGTYFLLLGLGLVGMGLGHSAFAVVASLCVQQTAAGMGVITLIAWAHTRFPFEHRGRAMGIWSCTFFLGQFVSPAIVHQVKMLSGTMQSAFVALGLTSIFVSVVGFVMTRSRQPSEQAL